MKAVQSSSHVSIVPSLSSSSHVFASPVSDRASKLVLVIGNSWCRYFFSMILNVKFLRSLPSEWDTHVVVWMNKPDFETMGLDDLYNNFKIVEQKVKRTVLVIIDEKNLAFLTTSSPKQFWMNKPDFETMGLDDLYNNFKIVEQKVKRTVAVNNDDKNLAFLTTSSPSSTNSINTANTGVSTGNSKVNTAN
ncbi:hypothetical protein Tco_1354131 [Tanacetum coccineum]